MFTNSLFQHANVQNAKKGVRYSHFRRGKEHLLSFGNPDVLPRVMRMFVFVQQKRRLLINTFDFHLESFIKCADEPQGFCSLPELLLVLFLIKSVDQGHGIFDYVTVEVLSLAWKLA